MLPEFVIRLYIGGYDVINMFSDITGWHFIDLFPQSKECGLVYINISAAAVAAAQYYLPFKGDCFVLILI